MVLPLAVSVNPYQAVLFFYHLKTDCSALVERFNVTENEVKNGEVIRYNACWGRTCNHEEFARFESFVVFFP